MFGPVFSLEMILASRRRRSRRLRWFVRVAVALQTLGFAAFYLSSVQTYLHENGYIWPSLTDEMSRQFVGWLADQQFLLILLATPPLAAGAITDEKMRGTLLYLFSAQLSSWEILLGKLLGRCYEVVVLLLLTLPVLAFYGIWAGITWWRMIGYLLSWLGPLLTLGSLSLLVSVWSRQTRDAVITAYLLSGLLYGLWRLSDWVGSAVPTGLGLRRVAGYFAPDHVLLPVMAGEPVTVVIEHLVGSWLAWGVIGGPAFLVAVWRLRGAFSRQLEQVPQRGIQAWLLPTRQPVHEEPLYWKERQVDGLAPWALLRSIPRWFAIPTVSLIVLNLIFLLIAITSGLPVARISGWVFSANLTALRRIPPEDLSAAFLFLGILVMCLTSLVVGIRCSGAISSEREKQTWEALLLTPLEVRQLVRAKLWGIMGAASPYVLASLVPTVIMATLVSPPTAWVVTFVIVLITGIVSWAYRRRLDGMLAYWAFAVWALMAMVISLFMGAPILFVVWLMTVVTALAMFYMGAAGIWCSARSHDSWHSLVSTLGLGYVGGIFLWLLTSPLTLLVGLMLFVLFRALSEADLILGTKVADAFRGFVGPGSELMIGVIASGLVLAGVFLGLPWWFISSTERYIANRDRIRVWRLSETFIGLRSRRRYRQLKHPTVTPT